MAKRFGNMLAALGLCLLLAGGAIWAINRPGLPNAPRATNDWLANAMNQGFAQAKVLQREAYTQCLYSQAYAAGMQPRELCPVGGNLYLLMFGGAATLVLGFMMTAAASERPA